MPELRVASAHELRRAPFMNHFLPKNTWFRITFGLAMVLPMACYPVLFAYFHNASEATMSQLWPLLATYVAVAACVFLIFSCLARDAITGIFVSNIAVILFAYYRPVEDFLRAINWHMRYWHIVPVLFLGLALLAYLSQPLSEPGRQALKRANRALALIFSLLILYNGAKALPTLFGKARVVGQARQFEIQALPLGPANSNHFPNVYYILLDEYSAFDMIQKHYNYDNSAFARFLESQGFTVSRTSHNPSPCTPEVLAHLIGMDPSRVPSSATDASGHINKSHLASVRYRYYDIIHESQLTRFFKSYGYEILVADMGKLFINHPVTLLSDQAYAPDPAGQVASTHNTLQGVTISKSVLYVLGQDVDPHFYNRMVNGIFDWIVLPRHRARPFFLYAHVICPHTPFAFDKNGHSINGGVDWHNKAYYLGQFNYVTDRISNIVQHLVKNDPDCVIMLQSDHSARMWEPGLAELPLADMTAILNAVYFRGLPLDIEGRSGLDTGLTIYHRLFGVDFPEGKVR